MRGMSHREALARLEWAEEQWNRPGRLEEYIIQLTEVVHGLVGRRSNRNRFVLKFKRSPKTPDSAKPKTHTLAELSKAAWKMRLGPQAKILKVDNDPS